MRTLVKPRSLFIGLSALCLLSIWLSLALGPVSLPLFDTLRAALRLVGVPIAGEGLEQAELILGQIRLPRTLLGLAVGGVLALSGVAMQGLFRNPLADPGLVGVSSGAALGAAIAIVGGAAFGGLPEFSVRTCCRCVRFLVAWGSRRWCIGWAGATARPMWPSCCLRASR